MKSGRPALIAEILSRQLWPLLFLVFAAFAA